MIRTFIQTREFSRNWDELGFDDEDLRMLELDIMNNPQKYPVMKGTGGLRKARISLDNKGKSKGARANASIYHFERSICTFTRIKSQKNDICSWNDDFGFLCYCDLYTQR